jgi:Ca2+-binding RTX toxin-like protein
MPKYLNDVYSIANSPLYKFTGSATQFITGGSNSDLFFNDNNLTSPDNNPAKQYFLLGGGGSDTITGAGGADLLSGGDGRDFLNGEDGNDRLEGGLGNDQLIGGSGVDTAYYLGDYSRYTITTNGLTTTVTDSDLIDGTDTLTGVEFLQFHNGHIPVAQQATDGHDILDGSAEADT